MGFGASMPQAVDHRKFGWIGFSHHDGELSLQVWKL